MERPAAGASEALLVRLNRELERISVTQHRLARRKALLQHQATRLRLGASPVEVRLALRVATQRTSTQDSVSERSDDILATG